MAEQALKAGRIRAATCYVNVAYAIFDANLRPWMTEGREQQGLA